MSKRICMILIGSAVLWHLPASAQRRKPAAVRDTIRANTIEVVQSYRPEVKQTAKPVFEPDMPPGDTSTVRLRYEVPALPLQFTYRSRPLKPLALGRDTTVLPFENYAKLGGGNLSTVYLDAGIGSLHGENYETAIRVHHLSQQGNIRYQKSMQTGADLNGTLHSATHTWTGGIHALRQRYYNYGYDHALYPGYEPPAQVLGGIRLQAGAQNNEPGPGGLRYHPQVSASLFSGSRISQEQQYTAQVPFSVQIDSNLTVHAGLTGSFVRLDGGGTVTEDAAIFSIRPGLELRKGLFSGHAFLSPTFGKGGNAYLLPDIAGSLRVPGTQLLASAGWSAQLRQFSYERFFLRNPFIGLGGNNLSGLLTQNRTDEVYGVLQTALGNHISLSGRVSWWEFRNLPLFLNDPSDRSRFLIVHDPRIRALSFQAGARYQVGNSFGLGLTGTWFNYYSSTVTHVWHEPGVQIRGDFMFRPLPDLVITGYALVLDQIYATDVLNKAVKLRTILDLGGGVEYSFIPRLSVFVQVNNILNNRYQRWQEYPSYGLNIFGGLRVKF